MKTKNMDGRKSKHEVLTELRKRAVGRVQSGESPEVVVRAMGFTRVASTTGWPCIVPVAGMLWTLVNEEVVRGD